MLGQFVESEAYSFCVLPDAWRDGQRSSHHTKKALLLFDKQANKHIIK